MFIYSILFIFIAGKCELLEGKIKTENEPFKLGLENISSKLIQKINGLGIGLITNQTGIDQAGKRNIDVLLSKGFKIKAIYAPEHGITGKIEAEKKIENLTDKKTRIPIISLYEGDSKFKKFDENDLKNIVLFIFDIQDSGMRHYTYISILYRMMEVAAKFNKKFLVLDRPNPLGILMEGSLVEPEFISFISIASIPIRHALTVGELAKYFNKFYFKNAVDLEVVPMKNYQRSQGLNGHLPIFLSPNITNIDACLNYSFLGILGEIAPINVGVGTKYAFKCIGLPLTQKFPLEKWKKLKDLLNDQNIDSHLFAYKKNDIRFIGLKIKINDINKFSGFNTLIKILKFFKDNGIQLNYSKMFNKVMGFDKFEDLLTDNSSALNISRKLNKELKEFFIKVKDILIYLPWPKIVETKI